MKGILVIVDGMGDFPNKQLEEKTPLEAAYMPNLDFLATRGEMGYLYPVKPGFIPESDESIISLFGNDLIFGTRGQLEAIGADLNLTRGDLALRANFAAIDSLKNGNILDRRAGRTLTFAEAEILSKAINKIKLSCDFVFEPTLQHQASLVLRGGFSDNLLTNDLTYIQGKSKNLTKVGRIIPLDEEENSQYTANILNEFLDKVYEVLNEHPINLERKKRGLMPANYLLVRGAGIETPKLKQYKKWLSVSYFPLEKGFSKASGMNLFSFDYPKLRNLDSYKNLWDGLRKACDFSKKTIKKYYKKYDYAYIHLSEVDLSGHDNKPVEKKEMLEYIDRTFFRFLREFAPPNKIKVVVTSNHSTPCKLKNHSEDPVPVLFYNDSIPKKNPFFSLISFKGGKEEKVPPKGIKFCEREARKGSLGRLLGKELLKKVGFVR